jgi:hypothetical protein
MGVIRDKCDNGQRAFYLLAIGAGKYAKKLFIGISVFFHEMIVAD